MNTHDIEITRKWLQQQPIISIIPHKNPDGDAIGSCLGLCLYLRQLQLNATVVSPNDFPEFLKWLPAVDDIIIYDNDQERAKTQIEA
ncbi:MAG: bifunctional oligoribonuclease/PAP phosphatase NrnA, partial [Capnocytophaga sp.]